MVECLKFYNVKHKRLLTVLCVKLLTVWYKIFTSISVVKGHVEKIQSLKLAFTNEKIFEKRNSIPIYGVHNS